MTKETTNNLYRIGAVSRLTSISPDTLRVWERRYQLVDPQRTAKGGRLYTQQDVSRLTMIKTLVDQGHAISTIANLSPQELSKRLSQASPHNLPEIGSGQHDVCVVGQAISVRAINTKGMPEGLELAGTYTDLNAFLEDDTDCDTLIIEMPSLDRENIRQLSDKAISERCQKVIVLYAFSSSIVLRQLKRLRITTERAPIAIEHLWKMCINQAPQKIDWEPIPFKPDDSSNEIVPPRLFNPKQLAVFSQLSSAIKCECPQHLSTIIETLNAFEDYSAKCENATKQDAALHSYLNVMTAKARRLIEEALHKLAEIEEINIQALN